MSGRREGRPQLNALMAAARNREIDCVLVWKFDRFARSTRHLLTALEEFDHLGVRFVSVQDQIDTDSPMGRAMFTIIGAMAELESSLVSERVTAGMRAAEARGRHLGRPATPQRVVREIEALARSTDLSIRQIQKKIAGRASRSIVGEITKRARATQGFSDPDVDLRPPERHSPALGGLAPSSVRCPDEGALELGNAREHRQDPYVSASWPATADERPTPSGSEGRSWLTSDMPPPSNPLPPNHSHHQIRSRSDHLRSSWQQRCAPCAASQSP